MTQERKGAAGVETTTLQSIACGGTGGDLTAVDSRDGKIVRIRPMHYEERYTEDEMEASRWTIEVDGEKFRPAMKAAPNYFALAYKNRVYSKNRVRYPLKRIDWSRAGIPRKSTRPTGAGPSSCASAGTRRSTSWKARSGASSMPTAPIRC